MEYKSIIDAAIAYSDKQDIGVDSNIDTFLRVVEARASDRLETGRMSRRCTISTNADQEYYGLPDDFDGLRDIQIDGVTLEYLAPNQMNRALVRGYSVPVYTVIADQLEIYPATDCILEIVYYSRVEPLSDTHPSNWLSRMNPNVYIFGLLVEISAFVKDSEAALLWDSRFKEEISALQLNDSKTRWSGTPLTVKAG